MNRYERIQNYATGRESDVANVQYGTHDVQGEAGLVRQRRRRRHVQRLERAEDAEPTTARVSPRFLGGSGAACAVERNIVLGELHVT
jgi:hypothetical protein